MISRSISHSSTSNYKYVPLMPPCESVISQFPSEVHEILEQHAIYCLMRLRRYDQVGYSETSPASMLPMAAMGH